MVNAGWPWPRRSLTTLTSAPDAMSSEAWVVPQVVEAAAWNVGAGDDALEELADRLGG